MKRKILLPSTEDLNDELFSEIEYYQGRAFVSDGMGAMKQKEFLNIVQTALGHTLTSARIMEEFLKKYGVEP